MSLFAAKGREKQLSLFESLKYLNQQTTIYTKLATVTLKQDVKFVKKVNSIDCVSLLTACNMFKTFVKCFLMYYEHAYVCCDVFILTVSFLISLLLISNIFDTLSYFFCFQL